MKTERQKIEKWLDSDGWEYQKSSIREQKEGTIGLILFGAVLFVVWVFVTSMLSGDPFSDWKTSESDEVVPWFEEAALGAAIVWGLLSSYFVWDYWRYRDFALMCAKILCARNVTAINIYRDLPSQDKKRLKPDLLDYLELHERDNYDRLVKSHRDAWDTLGSDIEKREEMLKNGKALYAGQAVREYREVVKSEIEQLEKTREHELY